ncbi:MAG: efflux RND transporter permease subunit [Candidatus Hydrogenedentes bacterium]|nr:efflux RND transporter permease subunit [Candidatus Hydrogenedentota bacterium]
MTLSDVAIRRPVFTTMTIMAIIVLGVISFFSIGIDLFPRVEFPIITVISVLPAADPETVETTVTDPIEEAVSTIAAIKHLRSTSAESVSQVIIEFNLDKDIDVAYQEVQARLAAIRSELPDDLEEPVIEKLDVDAAPILSVVVSGDKPIRDLTRIADDRIKERIQRIPNVGQVRLVGGRDRQIWIWLDPARLVGHYLSVQDVMNAVRMEHVELPGGRVETGPTEFVVRTKAEFQSVEEIADMVVAYREGSPIRIRDIGRVEDGLQEERSMARLNGTRAIGLLVRRQSGTNTVQVADAVKHEVALLQKELKDQGVSLEIAQDQSIFVSHSVREVQFHLLFGGGLAILIVFVFLRNLRSTFISALVIPTAIIGTFVLMNALGFTQNMMTLLALSLAIGLLIDDSIVVQENIMRHIEHGMPRREAASFATREITLAVLATTLSVMAVFVPVAFMEGQVGRFFYQFGLTVTFAVAISMYVAFTLDPMLSSRILRKPEHGLLFRITERALGSVDHFYGRVLRHALRWRGTVILLSVALFAGTLYVSQNLRSEFIPLEDQSEFNIKVKAPLGSSIYTTDMLLDTIQQRMQGQAWLDYCFTTIGSDELQRVNEASMYVKMKQKSLRTDSQEVAMAWAREALSDVKDAKVSVEIVPHIAGGGRTWADFQLEVRGPDLKILEETANAVMAKISESPGYVDLDITYDKNKPEANFYINRDASADLGVPPLQLAATIKALVGGEDVAKFRAEGDRFDISVRLDGPFRDDPEKVPFLTLRSTRGELVRIQNVATLQKEYGPVQIDRYNRTRQITVMANLQREQKVLGEAIEEVSAVVAAMKLPPGYTYGFGGMANIMSEGFENLILAMFLSLAFIYMVLAAQFESFIHPFTIMLSIPLSITGAILALLITGMTVSIYALIGIIMLMGLVTKNGILLVDYTNTLRRRDGFERNDAVIHAGPARLRPIVMTTLAIIFGMLPIALGQGEGSESRAPMAIAVIGGLIVSTALTLVVVPVVYTLLDDLGGLLRRKKLKTVPAKPH